MDPRVAFGLGLIILAVLAALVTEIISFSTKPRVSSTIGIKSTSKELTSQTELLAKQMKKMYNYNAHYRCCYVPESTPLTSWCANVGIEVKKTTKSKFTTVTGIYYFQSKHQNSCVPVSFHGPPTHHVQVVVPVSGKATITTGDKTGVLQEGVAVIKSKHTKITCDEFFLVIVQPFLAWDIV